MSERGAVCPCDDSSEWCRALVETGYPFCPRCWGHHRHPETCNGITEDGEDVPTPSDREKQR